VSDINQVRYGTDGDVEVAGEERRLDSPHLVERSLASRTDRQALEVTPPYGCDPCSFRSFIWVVFSLEQLYCLVAMDFLTEGRMEDCALQSYLGGLHVTASRPWLAPVASNDEGEKSRRLPHPLAVMTHVRLATSYVDPALNSLIDSLRLHLRIGQTAKPGRLHRG
jgi:hypothetical protein